MYVCKVFYSEVGPSLDMHYQVEHISVYWTKGRSEVVCKVLSSLSQWPYGNTFHCKHTDTRVLQIQLLSIPISQIAPKLSQPEMGLDLHGNYKYCFSLCQYTNATLPRPSYTATCDMKYEGQSKENRKPITRYKVTMKFVLHKNCRKC